MLEHGLVSDPSPHPQTREPVVRLSATLQRGAPLQKFVTDSTQDRDGVVSPQRLREDVIHMEPGASLA